MSLVGKKFKKKAGNGKWVTYRIFDTSMSIGNALILYAKPRMSVEAIEVSERELLDQIREGVVELI